MRHGDLIRLRHLLSGQYLCIRPSRPSDTGVIRDESSILGVTVNQQKKDLTDKNKNSSNNNNNNNNDINNNNSIIKSMANTIIPFETFNSNSVNESNKRINDNEKSRIDKIAFIERIKNNSSVATTSEPDNTTLFYIFSCDYSKTKRPESTELLKNEMNYISMNESIYFQHENTSCKLKLNEKRRNDFFNDQNIFDTNIDMKMKMNINMNMNMKVNPDLQAFEYQGDIPLQPSDPSESKASILISTNANAYKLEEVGIEEVRDIIFACKLRCLLRTAVFSLQNSSKDGMFTSANIYKHLSSGLFTLSQWAILKYGNESSLMEYSSIDALNRRISQSRRTSIESTYSVALSNNSNPNFNLISPSHSHSQDVNDIFNQSYNSTKTKTLTVVERMDRRIYPNIVDNSSFNNSFASLVFDPSSSSKSTRREIIDVVSRATVKRRQKLLSDCRLLEIALHFSNIVFTLIRDQDNRLDELKIRLDEIACDNGTGMGGRRRNRSSGSSAPQTLIDCCVLVHEIVRSSVSLNNKENSLKIISINGNYVKKKTPFSIYILFFHFITFYLILFYFIFIDLIFPFLLFHSVHLELHYVTLPNFKLIFTFPPNR